MITIRYTKNLLLRAFCIVYLFAFMSFYVQIPGLYGDNGILPAKTVLENSKHKTFLHKVHYFPTLLWLAPYLGLDTSYALDVFALLGSFLAFTGFVSQKFCTTPLFAGLWSLYFSLYQVGQTFVSSSFDEFLLEAGFPLIFIIAPFTFSRKRSKGSPTDAISFWLLRWILFRFFVTSGIVKFISNCPKWWSLTALHDHFQSMPLPSPLAWYSYQLPHWFLKLTSVYVHVSEIVLPFLFFIPIRSVRVTGFIVQLFLQIAIVLTGNFSYLNLLLVTLLLSLLDDQFFYNRKREGTNLWVYVGSLLNILIHAAIIYGVIFLFSLKYSDSIIESKIAFTKTQFDDIVGRGLYAAAIIGFASLALTILYSLSDVLFNNQTSSSKLGGLISVIIHTALALTLFGASVVPLTSLHAKSNMTTDTSLHTFYNRLHKLHAVNQYNLFGPMVGSDGRKEIILEGADNIDGPWKEYSFLYKPGNVNHSLPFIAPHTPRLDWQMYWAAYSTYEKQPWLLSLAHRLLNGRQEVLALLDRNHSPFVDKPPKYIRAILYKYTYTNWNQRSQPTWWTRQKIGEYFPTYAKDSPALIDFLKARNLLPTTPKETVNATWKKILDSIRYVTSHLEPTLLLWSVLTAGCAVITTSGSGRK